MTGLIEPSQVINLFPKVSNEDSGASVGMSEYGEELENFLQKINNCRIRCKNVECAIFLIQPIKLKYTKFIN